MFGLIRPTKLINTVHPFWRSIQYCDTQTDADATRERLSVQQPRIALIRPRPRLTALCVRASRLIAFKHRVRACPRSRAICACLRLRLRLDRGSIAARSRLDARASTLAQVRASKAHGSRVLYERFRAVATTARLTAIAFAQERRRPRDAH